MHQVAIPGATSVKSHLYLSSEFLTVTECNEIQTMASNHAMRPAGLSGGLAAPSIRSAASCWLDEEQVPWLAVRLAKAVSTIIQGHFPFALTGFEEGILLLKYESGKQGQAGDFYDWHIDIGKSGATCTRKLSIIIQLSAPTVYSGGEFEANFDGNITTGNIQQGTLIAFPSFVLHRVSPLLTGTRFALAAWLHGPAFQ